MRITITSIASMSTVTDTWTMNFMNPCRLQSATTFALTSPLNYLIGPKATVINNNSNSVTWSFLYDAWDPVILSSSGCTLSVTLTEEDAARTEIPSSIYTTTVDFASTIGTIDIASWD
jgi:hypothetical protein